MSKLGPLGVQKEPSEINRFLVNFSPEEQVKAGLALILNHFASSWFPRTISTRTTQGRQVLVNSREEALARFKQANYLDCRINSYSKNDIKGDPNFIFIDIDSTDQKVIRKILNARFKDIGAHPTVLFTGSGFHIYQPIRSICLDQIEDFSSYQEPSKQFLKFGEKYLSCNKCDPDHNPSFKSCMVRVPGSINSKNAMQVKVIQEWDGQRPSIALLLGSFVLWISTKQKREAARFAQNANCEINHNFPQRKIQWIEVLLGAPLDDYRKAIVSLVLAPYLINIRQLEYQAAFNIIKSWLGQCASLRQLDFAADSLTGNSIATASKTGYKPMRLDTLKQRNPRVYEIIRHQIK